ncbi:MAG: hypothetical protein ACOY0T_01370 [Myxococcota bacterium]
MTMRVRLEILRTPDVFRCVLEAVTAANLASAERGTGFRVCIFSVQSNHLHLIVEAATHRALIEGMRGVSIRIARRLNRLLGRRGQLFAERWHGHALTSPREVRHAIVYVLANAYKHGAREAGLIDPFSSAPFFTGYSEYAGIEPCMVKSAGENPGEEKFEEDGFEEEKSRLPLNIRACPVVAARTWLLSRGWRKRGLISIKEVPARR